MIPRTPPPCQSAESQIRQNDQASPKWQKLLAQAIREPAELLNYLELPETLLSGAIAASGHFALRAPIGYCQRIEKGNPNDPLLRQILPLDAELVPHELFTPDPVGDLAALEVPGLLHKYHGRVLIITTSVCAIHCRYCFRREFPYQENRAEQNWQEAVNYIKQHTDIHEVILSGGDPLSLTESKLKNLTDKLINISHIKTLRIHTRQPIVLPERINSEFLAWLDSLPWKLVIVLHSNHANEIDRTVTEAIKKLQQHGITLLNQSVLLAGVNDDSTVLSELSHKLFQHNVMPYYLHLLDKVQGAQHFYVNKEKASQLLEELRERLPGYLIPKLVEEIAGEKSKKTII